MNKFTAGLQCIKRMKNLFSINKTEGRDQNEFDPTPYMAARVSEAVQNKLKHSFSVMDNINISKFKLIFSCCLFKS